MPAMCQPGASRCHLFPNDELLLRFKVHYCQDAHCQVAASLAKLPAAKLHGALPFSSEESDEEESENLLLMKSLEIFSSLASSSNFPFGCEYQESIPTSPLLPANFPCSQYCLLLH